MDEKYGMRGAMVSDNALVVIDQSHIIPRVAMEHPPPANKDNNRPRNASPAAIATIIKDETPIIGLHGIHASTKNNASQPTIFVHQHYS